MRIRAKVMGYYDLKRRYPGDEFDIENEKEFSKRWMEKVNPDEEPKKVRPTKMKERASEVI